MKENNTLQVKFNDDVKSIVDLETLKNTEQSVLNYMLLSFDKYQKVKNELKEEDFTFGIFHVLFNYLVHSEEKLLEISTSNMFDIKKLNTFIKNAAYALDKNNIVRKESVIKILSRIPSIDINKDINLLKQYSIEKEFAIFANNKEKDVVFYYEDLVSEDIMTYIDNRLIDSKNSNIDHLPKIFADTGSKTLDNFVEIQNDGDYTLSITTNEESVKFFITKDFDLVEQKKQEKRKKVKNLFDWADKYKLDEETFPRDINKLEKMTELNISNKAIDEIPKEIDLLKSLVFLDTSFNKLKDLPEELKELNALSFISLESNELEEVPKAILNKINWIYISLKKNKIKKLPDEISNFKRLNTLCLCCNQIDELPESFYELKNLTSTCMHNNRISLLSPSINKLQKLETFAISNNYIVDLPVEITALKNIKSLDIENNDIPSVDFSISELRNLTSFSFDDELFSTFKKDIKQLKNIDTINVEESLKYKNLEDIKELNLSVDNKSWVEKNDKRDNGCVRFFSSKREC